MQNHTLKYELKYIIKFDLILAFIQILYLHLYRK